ncbi:MAG: MBL fold metallo-hydrolase [Promethearchaeota archaeon]|nr:MAG: MBL fold metallo-hydrolase [Candidatus Lokiarchaeota archaeon]
MTLPNSLERFPSIKKMGVTVDCGDFLIIRPAKSYRMHSSVVILKGNEPVIIDTGTTIEPGMKRIKKALAVNNISPTSVKYIILTHAHQDHFLQLQKLQKFCSNAKVICHERDVFNIQHPTRVQNAWHVALKLLGKSQFNRFFYAMLSVPGYMLFYRTLNFYPRIDYVVNSGPNHGKFDLEKFPKINVGKKELYLVPTPGHSAGHMCVWNKTDKFMFLGDFVPFTPWINPLSEALDDMIESIQNFLKIPNNQVEYAISAHGDIRRENWEIMEWSCAKEKFQIFLDTIIESLDRIPKYILKKPLTAENIAQLLIPNYKRYLWVMRVFFIPPALTWVLAYCQKLEQQGKIKRIKIGNTVFWAAN